MSKWLSVGAELLLSPPLVLPLSPPLPHLLPTLLSIGESSLKLVPFAAIEAIVANKDRAAIVSRLLPSIY